MNATLARSDFKMLDKDRTIRLYADTICESYSNTAGFSLGNLIDCVLFRSPGIA